MDEATQGVQEDVLPPWIQGKTVETANVMRQERISGHIGEHQMDEVDIVIYQERVSGGTVDQKALVPVQ